MRILTKRIKMITYSVGAFTRSGQALGTSDLSYDSAKDLAAVYASRGLVAEIYGWKDGQDEPVSREVVSE